MQKPVTFPQRELCVLPALPNSLTSETEGDPGALGRRRAKCCSWQRSKAQCCSPFQNIRTSKGQRPLKLSESITGMELKVHFQNALSCQTELPLCLFLTISDTGNCISLLGLGNSGLET